MPWAKALFLNLGLDNMADIALQGTLKMKPKPRPRFDFVEWEYGKYLKGKRVLLIGGSEEKTDAASTESYDVVIRVNGHLERQGGRCDVMYHTCVPGLTGTLAPKLKRTSFIFLNLVDTDCSRQVPVYADFLSQLLFLRNRTKSNYPMINVGYFAQGTWLERNPYGSQYEWLNELHQKYNTKFFTGLVALAHVLRFNPANVFVRGMNMYVKETGGKVGGRIESHELEGNLNFLADVREDDDRVVFCEELIKALGRYGY